MVEAGARPGSVLFRGKVENGHYAGTAFMFDRRCGQISYAVSGPVLDSDQRVVLSGEAPLVGAKCRLQGSFTEVLEFRLQNANRTAKAMAPESAPSPSLQTDERAAAATPAPPAPPSEARPASPNPSAVIAELAPVQKQAAAPTALPPAPDPPAVAGDRALAQKQAAVSPPPPSAPNLPAAVTDHGPAQKQAALSLAAPPPAANPDLAAEIERTRAAASKPRRQRMPRGRPSWRRTGHSPKPKPPVRLRKRACSKAATTCKRPTVRMPGSAPGKLSFWRRCRGRCCCRAWRLSCCSSSCAVRNHFAKLKMRKPEPLLRRR